jgi:anti-sigma factor RsiW
LRCSSFHKNLSAFLDDELDSRKRKQMELHLSECEDCRREAEKLRHMIGIIGSLERPAMPAQLWEGTRQKLAVASETPTRTWRIFNMPTWVFAPAGGVVLAVLVYFLSSQLFFQKYTAEPVPVADYIQEHALSCSEQALTPDLMSELTLVQTGLVAEEAQYDEPMSELEMLMEVHYGTNPTNGS